MAVVTLRSLSADMASKLDKLETQAAVLERDARNGRSIATIALNVSQRRADVLVVKAAVWPRAFGSAYRAVRSSRVWLHRAARSPRLHSALRGIREWLLESVYVLSLTSAALLAVVVAILLLAPPD